LHHVTHNTLWSDPRLVLHYTAVLINNHYVWTCEIHATKNKLLERKLTTYETTLSISARLQQLSCNIMQMLGSVSFKLSLLLRVWDVYVCWKRS